MHNPTVVIFIYSVPLINRFFGAPVIIVLPIIASGVVIELYKYFSVVCINGFCVAIDNVIVINNHVGSVVARQLVWAELECIVPGISNREQLCAIAIYGWLFVITTITDADIGITSLLPPALPSKSHHSTHRPFRYIRRSEPREYRTRHVWQ